MYYYQLQRLGREHEELVLELMRYKTSERWTVDNIMRLLKTYDERKK